MTTTPAHWICPECSGPWIRNFVFDHNRSTCSIGKAEDATQYADHQRFGTRSIIERPSTDAELILVDVFQEGASIIEAEYRRPHDSQPATPPVMTTVTPVAAGIHHRIVAGIDPDTLNKENQS